MASLCWQPCDGIPVLETLFPTGVSCVTVGIRKMSDCWSKRSVCRGESLALALALARGPRVNHDTEFFVGADQSSEEIERQAMVVSMNKTISLMQRWFFFSVAAIGLAACESSNKKPSEKCDCDANQTCIDGTCFELCASSAQCPDDHACDTQQSVCVPVKDAVCSGPGDCTSPPLCYVLNNQVACAEGQCVYSAAPSGAACQLPTDVAGEPTGLCNTEHECKTDLGNSCLDDSWCTHGKCECDSETCEAKICAPVECQPCEYYNGTLCVAIPTQSPPVTDVLNGCSGTNACYDGWCLPINNNVGAACYNDATCTPQNCECTSASCSQHECSPIRCATCEYFDGTACIDIPIEDPPIKDALNGCDGVNACYNGVCAQDSSDIGDSCLSDDECILKHCECSSATCAAHVCAPTECDTCSYYDGTGCLDIPTQNPIVKDSLNGCDDTHACYDGVCLPDEADLGMACTADGECNHGNCECKTSSCNEHWCAIIECDVCEYYDGEGCIDIPRTDPAVKDSLNDCDDTHACYDGVCLPDEIDLGTACSYNQNCNAQHCECSSETCEARLCAPIACPQCQYYDGATCLPIPTQTPPVQDILNLCWQFHSCYDGVCLLDADAPKLTRISVEGDAVVGWETSGWLEWHRIDTYGADLGVVSARLEQNLFDEISWDATFTETIDLTSPHFALYGDERSRDFTRTFTFYDQNDNVIKSLVISHPSNWGTEALVRSGTPNDLYLNFKFAGDDILGGWSMVP
ncbi:MAG: hypothetical protein A2289_00960 [Deltaproteobacteria bacterium RIFOXYA12_FULL_58_15]|nr:MAG: hypothetical protein A2289_00960 [Deltaproteobacteria bacterium RIFOXYA12_FULL_58_15]